MTFSPAQLTYKGYALIMVMIFLGVTLLVLGSVMFWTYNNSKNIKRNNVYFTSQAAAEAAVEQVIANMNRDYLQQSINSAGTYQTNIPSQTGWPIQYTFSSAAGTNKTYVNIGATSTALQPLGSQWSGLQGYPATNQITSTATPINQLYTVPATITENMIYADIPLFQFAIFYNMNLEVQPGSGMNVGGPVFCNQSIWAASPMTFSNSVTAAGTINSNNISDPFMTAGSKNGSGNPNFMGGTATNHSELNMPIGTNNNPASVEAVLQFPPSTYALGTSAAYTTTNGQLYFANQADLIITNNSGGGWTNISVYWQDAHQSPAITAVPYDYYIIAPKTNLTQKSYTNTIVGLSSSYTNLYSGYSFVTNVQFYDYRESDTVQAIQINVTNLGVWAASSAANGGSTISNSIYTDKGHNIDSIYVYNSVPLSNTNLPAVRIVNGAQLPTSSGLAVATPDPLYVMGNFNTQTSAGNDAGLNSTTYTYPAALFGDALTVLSSSWNDTNYTQSGSYASYTNRVPVAMTINAATLEGIVPSSGSIYSGGAENFLRLLEDWGHSGGVTLTYNGSIVVMFPSQYATNYWGNSSYYGVPTRHWAFDLNFTHQGGLPPMTPRVKGIIRQGWVP